MATATRLVGQKNYPARLAEVEVKAGGTGWYKYPAHKFPTNKVIILDASQWDMNTTKITYYANGQKNEAVVPNDFKVEKARKGDKTIEALWKEYGQEVIKNIDRSLGHSFTIGSDPEIFVEDGNGQIIPAFNFLGSKEKPNKTWDTTYGGLPMYWDGFQAEFVTSAQNCLAWQVDSVQAGLKGLIKAARKKYPDAKLSTKTVFEIPQELLNDSADEHVQFGCMPSKNAYGLKGAVANGRETTFRPAGGHIHFGIGNVGEENANRIVKALDAIVGVACVSLFENFDNPIRRRMYGLPGEYRLPAHGLEYRTLSNAWMFHPLIQNLVFDLARKAVVFGQKGLNDYWDATEGEVIETITFCDAAKAREILARNKELFLKIISAIGGSYRGKEELVYNIFMKPMEETIENPHDVEGNWNVDKTWVIHSDGQGKNWLHAYQTVEAGRKVK